MPKRETEIKMEMTGKMSHRRKEEHRKTLRRSCVKAKIEGGLGCQMIHTKLK
jgi:hypothetical protein